MMAARARPMPRPRPGPTDFRPDLPRSKACRPWSSTAPATPTCRSKAPASKVAEALPHARLIEYDGSPHGVFETDKERLARDVVGFLTEDVRGTTADTSASAIPLNS
jgi:non-heme chloroperoxidase